MAPLIWSTLYFPFLIIVSLMVTKSSLAVNYLYGCCTSTTTFAQKSQYQTDLQSLFIALQSNADSNPNGFYNTSYGNGKERVYGLYLCRGDQQTSSCSDCVRTAIADLTGKGHCPNGKAAIMWYDECMLRYSNESFLGILDELPAIFVVNVQNVTGNQIELSELLAKMMNTVTNEAADGGNQKKYATDKQALDTFQTLYTLGQCTPDLSAEDCNQCLEFAMEQLPLVRQGARTLTPSCNVRYETYPFFNSSTDTSVSPSLAANGIVGQCSSNVLADECRQCLKNAMSALSTSGSGNVNLCGCKVTGPPSSSRSPATKFHGIGTRPTNSAHTKKKHLWVPVSIAILPFILISLVAFALWRRIYKRRASIPTPTLDVDEMKTMESLQFDLSTVRAATRNFSIDNKLGEGGFGEVYKGVLEGQQEIAVKRLSKSSGQGVEEFKTEVLLVAKLQHKNLVKLLGFCLASKEKILIYEYLRNSSLDQVLFDPVKKLSLDWKTRFKVIVGIARGLMYLHEDSRLKIIHRDLKPSNILLDDNMNPKISDFGLAKLFGVDQTEGDTKRIVGTYGYMAPEYAMTGHFSVKSDVYSFGIIVLEIVSGQKNRFFGRPQLEEALLHRAWRLWNEKNALQLVDTTLDDRYPKQDVSKCIHLSLLCIQETALDRPRMATIVAALNGQSVSLPMPKAPNCFGDSSIITDMASAQYRLPVAGHEIEYRQVLDQNGNIYSGTENITDLHPR